jgi:hypothetical protein
VAPAAAAAPSVVGFNAQGQPIYGSPQGAGGAAQAMPQQAMPQQVMPQQVMPQQVMPGQQMAQPAYPPQQVMAPQPQYAPQGYPQQQSTASPQMQPQYQQPQYPQQQYPQQMTAPPLQQPAYPRQSSYPQQQPGMYQPGYGNAYAAPRTAPRMPYQADPRYGRSRVRGEENPAVRVLYDRWSLGDSAYFTTACGALLTVDAGVLTFTSGCGGTPLVIPAAEIAEIAMNVLVGKDIGAFHIATAKGLYLACTGEIGSRDQSREIVEGLKKRLKLSE